MTLAIVNGHLIDPAAGTAAPLDLLIDGSVVAKIGTGLTGDQVIDASGCVVCPGLVDIHVHFREPGFESKETIQTGCRAAARGGVTTVVTMANTAPPIDNAGMVEFVQRRAREEGCIKVRPAACATKGMKGEELTEMAELHDVGAVAVTDDGRDIPSSWTMRRVLEYAKMAGLPVLAHCEDPTLGAEGAMNEGFNSTKLGIPGIPKAVEEIAIERNIRIAELTGAHLHIQHVTTAEGVNIIRRAKAKGINVTCETCPHYWTLTDDAVLEFDTNAKMNPPLREAEDVAAIIEGLKDGTIDCIATDHAPHTATEKNVEFGFAPFGIVGLETLLGLTITDLVAPGHLSIERAIALMTCEPSRICDLGVGVLREGGPADVCVFDPNAEWTVDPERFASR
ncbi:MAG TPA: dihydroorotase, partial [Candidatus Hydrogenedentes bacterium]|nr:dihydroorotase [Candidatus Hydrogenedentota bacterium]